MTIRELANFCDRDMRTVRRWVAKAGDKVSHPHDRVSQGMPHEYSLEEVEEILKASTMSKDAVAILMQNAQMQNEPQNEPQTAGIDYEKLAMVIATAVTTALASVAGVAKEQQLQIEAPLTHQTLLGYCNAHDIEDANNTNRLRSHGLILRGICGNRGLEIKRVAHERYGTINSYPIEVLEEYFSI